MWGRIGMRGYVGGAMTHWDETAAQYDFAKISPLLGGRIKYGYPTLIGAVDVRGPGVGTAPHDANFIAQVTSGTEAP